MKSDVCDTCPVTLRYKSILGRCREQRGGVAVLDTGRRGMNNESNEIKIA